MLLCAVLAIPTIRWIFSENALAEPDALVSWGLKYNVHIMPTITGNPDMWNAGDKENVSAANVIQEGPYYNDLYGAEYTGELFYENLVAYGESIAEKYGGV